MPDRGRDLFPALQEIAKEANPKLIAATEQVKVELTADPADAAPCSIRSACATFTGRATSCAGPSRTTRSTTTCSGSGRFGNSLPKSTAPTSRPRTRRRAIVAAAVAAGYPKAGDATIVKTPTVGGVLDGCRSLKLIGLLFILVLFVTMVYGPIAALLVELFPTRIRYTGMSVPYHIGNGWFGGFLPPTAFAIVAATGNIFAGLWYPIIVALMTFVIGLSSCPRRRIATSSPTRTSGKHRSSPKRKAPPKGGAFFVSNRQSNACTTQNRGPIYSTTAAVDAFRSRWSHAERPNPRPRPRGVCATWCSSRPRQARSTRLSIRR